MRYFPFGFFALFFLSCLSAHEEQKTTDYYRITGATMGTSYHITYRDSLGRNLKPQVDSLLDEVNLGLSTYLDSSLISRFNRSEEGLDFAAEAPALRRHFLANYRVAYEIYQLSEGYFDPTVMPLVNYWGFGYTPKGKSEGVDSALIDSLHHLVGMDKLKWEGSFLRKSLPGMQLDFSAIAKGYGVDVVGDLLTSLGCCDWLVEIGGELAVSGERPDGGAWQIGINTPEEGADPSAFALTLPMSSSCGLLWEAGEEVTQSDLRGLASSGNYRNFYEEGGEKFVHTINPHTGYTKRSKLLSASIRAVNCTRADALATACMAMGKEKAIRMLDSLENVEAWLIFVATSGEQKLWKKLEQQ